MTSFILYPFTNMLGSVISMVKNLFGPDDISDQLSTSSEESNMDNLDLTTDAAVQGNGNNIKIQLQESDLRNIESQLKEYEFVSIVYLVCDSAVMALQLLKNAFNNNFENTLVQWAKTDSKWDKKLIEALCLIQNYEVLHKLHYAKDNMIECFQPHHIYVENYVSKQRKSLYYLCESLESKETDKLIKLVHIDKIGKPFETFSQNYLEQYLLHWESLTYDFTNLLIHLKAMELDDLKDKLSLTIIKKNIQQPNNEQINLENQKIGKKTVDNAQMNSLSSEVSSQFSMEQDTNESNIGKYVLSKDNPGVCLIFNQEHFHSEFDSKYKKLLSPERLSDRKGTEHDFKKLQETFTSYGFQVIPQENRTHVDMLNDITNVVANIENESSMFVVILSHGDKNIVYGSNSCRVNVNQIKKILCGKKNPLQGKPKVIILQSCQGKEIQKITDESDDSESECTTDGPSHKVPDTADLLTFWATVPGFAAIRNERSGTWFIQSLCEKINKFGNKMHFLDICTTIVNDVTSKTWKNKVMTPFLETTFRKSLYLPPRNI